MDINETKLSEIPEVKELLKVLSDNGLLRKKTMSNTLFRISRIWKTRYLI